MLHSNLENPGSRQSLPTGFQRFFDIKEGFSTPLVNYSTLL